MTTGPCSPLAGPQQVNASPRGVCALLSPRFSPQQSPAGSAASERLSKELHFAAALSSRRQVQEAPKAVKLSEFGVSKHQGPFLLLPTAPQRQGGKRRLGTWGSLLQRGAFMQ